MGNLPFERTRYNPVQDVTGEEAERNKQQMNTADAARERTQAVPAQGSAGDDDEAEPQYVPVAQLLAVVLRAKEAGDEIVWHLTPGIDILAARGDELAKVL